MNTSDTFHSVLTMIASTLVKALPGHAANPSGNGTISTPTTTWPSLLRCACVDDGKMEMNPLV